MKAQSPLRMAFSPLFVLIFYPRLLWLREQNSLSGLGWNYRVTRYCRYEHRWFVGVDRFWLAWFDYFLAVLADVDGSSSTRSAGKGTRYKREGAA